MKELIVLIPAHNESLNIAIVVNATRQHLPVMVVDDGSTDDTASRAKDAGAMIVRQIPNQGKGAALVNGFKHVLDQGCQAVITLDGDGQHDPAEIPRFLAAFRKQKAGLIIGQRDFSRMPFIRRLANTLGRIVFSLAVGRDIPDNQSGYRLIDRKLMVLMLENEEQGFEFEVEMVVLALKNNLGIGWVPIRTIYSGGKSHIRPLNHLINFLRICLKARQVVHRE